MPGARCGRSLLQIPQPGVVRRRALRNTGDAVAYQGGAHIVELEEDERLVGHEMLDLAQKFDALIVWNRDQELVTQRVELRVAVGNAVRSRPLVLRGGDVEAVVLG